ncbi:MAG: hypothetical protein IJ455_04585 [Agathobacter sp.]|nr:hypothetical protein [Agathobacter sp.]
MSAQDNIEKVLRSLHVLLSKSEPYVKEPSKVIVDKQEMLDLLVQLNQSMYDIMDEYELTRQSRDRAEREFQKKVDEIVWNASRKAEDVYAASVMYTDEALNRVQDIMKEADASIIEIYSRMNAQLKEEEKRIKHNQLELKSTLQDLLDTEKYLKLIEERNRELRRQKENGKPAEESDRNIYANRQTEIKINQEYFDKMGISLDNVEEEEKENVLESSPVEIKVDLDADYFQWKEGKEIENRAKASKEKGERFQNMLKGFTSGKK